MPKSYIEQYADEIKAGNIIVGRWVRKQINNLLDDLNNPLYIFDPSECYRRFRFQETLCLQSKAP